MRKRDLTKKYIAVISEPYIRDAQIFDGNLNDATLHNPMIDETDDWVDIKSPEIYVGLYEAVNPETARQIAADSIGCDPAMVELHEI